MSNRSSVNAVMQAFETEDGAQLQRSETSIDEELSATLDVCIGSKDDGVGADEFTEATVCAKAGLLSFAWPDGRTADFALTNLRIQKVTNAREGRPWCMKMSLAVQRDGIKKYILDAKSEDVFQTLLSGLQDRITAQLDAKSALEVNQTNGENYPNMTFIPLKVHQPSIPPGEFALFLILLTAFMFNLSTQDFENDFLTTDSLKGMSGWVQFNKISTVEDYIGWWPVLLMSLKRWAASREGWLDQSIDLLADEQIKRECDLVQGCTEVKKEDINLGAVLLGHPFITQTRKLRFGVVEPPPFNASGSQECPWELFDAGAAQSQPSNDTLARVNSCYGSVRTSPDGELEYYIPQMQGILNGSYPWTPANWISADTTELSHQFTLYFPSARKFAVVRIWVNIDQAGRVGQQSLAGNYPSFEVYEPFMWGVSHIPRISFRCLSFTANLCCTVRPGAESDPRFVTLELLFYLFIVKLFIDELFEVWECICYQDLLLPLKVLINSLDLQLHEIMYFHERASQVYDPRDPTTQKAFKFPDLADLESHMNGKVRECEDVVETLESQLGVLKHTMAQQRGKQITNSQLEGWRQEMVDLQLKLTHAQDQVRTEEHVASVAAMMQLAVMWANDWSFDFPDHYLAEIGDDASIAEDGLTAFCDVNWIAVSRAYLDWCDASGHVHELKDEGSMLDVLSVLTFKVAHPFAGKKKTELEIAQYTPQFKHFDKLAPLVDYLDMLHDVLKLHTQLVTARQIKHWEGPHGANMGSTVSKAFQSTIGDYNRVGKRLKEEMQSFPEEIADGFSEPDQTKSETIKIKAKSLIRIVQSDVETAGMLGLFFPGSVLWELNRKTVLSAKYQKSKSIFSSIGSFGGHHAAVVSDSSMKVYVHGADVVGEDDEVVNPIADGNDTAWSPRSFNRLVHESGTPGWRTWVPRGAEALINYDGQFVVPHDRLKEWLAGTWVFPLFLWFKCGIVTYLCEHLRSPACCC